MGRGASRRLEPPAPAAFEPLIEQKAFKHIVKKLKPSIRDLFNLSRTCKALWTALGHDHALWRELYLTTDPLVTPDIKRRLSKEGYCHAGCVYQYHRCGLTQTGWMRAAVLLYAKPKLVLALSGRDPVILRHLGQPEAQGVVLSLGLSYHLDDYLDDEAARFAVEFPQLLQDLEYGDVVVTNDFKGSGCWIAVTDPAAEPFLRLHKIGHDPAGCGILSKDLAPPFFPLFYYCDATLEEAASMERAELKARSLYWFSYTQMADKSMYSWTELSLLEAL